MDAGDAAVSPAPNQRYIFYASLILSESIAPLNHRDPAQRGQFADPDERYILKA
jgi:hypothetical protein